MQPDRIRDSPLRTTKARKDRTRQAGAIRSELFMTSLLKGALETDTEISFYLPCSALTGLRCSKGVPYDPICLHLPSPAPTAPPTFVFRLRLPIPGWFSLAGLKTIITFAQIVKGFSEMPSGFTLNVKAFRKMTSPFTLNGEGISENSLTVDVKTYSPHQIFFPQLAKQQPERRGNLGGQRKS
ncbi:hypothetical protein [Clostridium sp. chh4-2]|uniref:hypothetical protein n=1 Tax=Clostridium sp. chh4-2 TaxID=2067550 RepID=UPI0011AEFA69|nr:hypothetical protein [Clostridium sp. chh4-2]